MQQERTSALAFKKPGIVAQIEFVKKYKPKVVTLTGGGNDVGFADVLGYCASGASVTMMPDTVITHRRVASSSGAKTVYR